MNIMQAPNVGVAGEDHSGHREKHQADKGKRIKCSRVRACKWKGYESDMVRHINKKDTKKIGVNVYDMCCPNCGCKTYYLID